jgi:hypothetical protein
MLVPSELHLSWRCVLGFVTVRTAFARDCHNHTADTTGKPTGIHLYPFHTKRKALLRRGARHLIIPSIWPRAMLPSAAPPSMNCTEPKALETCRWQEQPHPLSRPLVVGICTWLRYTCRNDPDPAGTGKYHVVDRWSTHRSPYAKLVEFLLELDGG